MPTVHDLHKVLREIEIREPLRTWLRPRLELTYDQPPDALYLDITWTAPHRDHGRPSVFNSRDHVPLGLSENEFLQYVRARLSDVMQHEVDEAIHWKGNRLYDPHEQRTTEQHIHTTERRPK